MDWTKNSLIFLNKGVKNFSWGNQHNGDCLKIYSQKVKEKVDSNERCHNPRCSGENPTRRIARNIAQLINPIILIK
jgi:hypothetical protein